MGGTACAGYMRHPFKKSQFDNDDAAFQVPFLRTDVLSSQHSYRATIFLTFTEQSCVAISRISRLDMGTVATLVGQVQP
jgi:hypothetical protein